MVPTWRYLVREMFVMESNGGAAMFSLLGRPRWLPAAFMLVLVAPPGRGLAAQGASSQSGGTPYGLTGVACASARPCVAVGWQGAILRSTDGGNTWRSQSGGRSEEHTSELQSRFDL